jgi:lipopolysaccharide assembly outer membrane protein LptD (OstA)
VDGIVAKILWKATQNLSFDLLTRYDIRSSTLLEETVSARFSTCCWALGLKFTHRIRPGEPDENNLQATFDLKMPTPSAVR